MTRRLFIGLAPLLAVAAFALTPAVAQAWQWYSNNVVLPSTGTLTPVATRGTLTLHVRAPSGAPIGVIRCRVNDQESVFNKSPFGFDEVENIVLSPCRGNYPGCPTHRFTIVPKGLHWFSELVTGSSPIRDEIQNIELEVRCAPGGPVLGTLTGSLTLGRTCGTMPRMHD
jgi:hypothetical protein